MVSYANLPDGPYTFYVVAKDEAGNEDPSPASRAFVVHYVPIDHTAPSPDPMTWAALPYPVSTTSIAMVATTATDETLPIHYLFEFVDSPTGGGGGADSGWQSLTSYTDSGFGVNHQYGYRVKARNGANNETAYSTPTRYV